MQQALDENASDCTPLVPGKAACKCRFQARHFGNAPEQAYIVHAKCSLTLIDCPRIAVRRDGRRTALSAKRRPSRETAMEAIDPSQRKSARSASAYAEYPGGHPIAARAGRKTAAGPRRKTAGALEVWQTGAFAHMPARKADFEARLVRESPTFFALVALRRGFPAVTARGREGNNTIPVSSKSVCGRLLPDFCQCGLGKIAFRQSPGEISVSQTRIV